MSSTVPRSTRPPAFAARLAHVTADRWSAVSRSTSRARAPCTLSDQRLLTLPPGFNPREQPAQLAANLSAKLGGRLLELAHQPTEGLAGVGVDDPHAVHDHPGPRQEPLELRAALNLVETLALPVQQEETGEVAPVRR
jgi:hypothetical protein